MNKKIIFYKLKFKILSILLPYNIHNFLFNYLRKDHIILDVGCGNDAVLKVKALQSNCKYFGLDIADYNLKEKDLIDSYIIADKSKFAEKILGTPILDIAICSHNLEHCEEPYAVLRNILRQLRSRGMLYLSFPSNESIYFPNRKGTLNYYDDPTHKKSQLKLKKIIRILKENGSEIVHSTKNNSPKLMKLIGLINERRSRKEGRILLGTSYYWGFESIFWIRKK